MILHINTKDQKITTVSLKKVGKAAKTLSEENKYGSSALLPLIEKICKQEKVEYKDLKGIEIAIGPGSFTGLRVGVSVANALGFSLEIPVNGKKIETELVY